MFYIDMYITSTVQWSGVARRREEEEVFLV